MTIGPCEFSIYVGPEPDRYWLKIKTVDKSIELLEIGPLVARRLAEMFGEDLPEPPARGIAARNLTGSAKR